MKQLPVSEYPEAWRLIVQAFLQTKCGLKVPKGWERNERLAPSRTVPAALLGESSFCDAWGCLEDPPAGQKPCAAAGPGGLLPITALPGPEMPKRKPRASAEEQQRVVKILGNYGGNVFVEKQHCALGGAGGKSCCKRQLRCQLMLTRPLNLFISNLVEIPRHPKDKVWRLSCKLVPLKSKQTMNLWSNYTRNFPDISAVT